MTKAPLSILIIDDDKYFKLSLISSIKDLGLITEASSEQEGRDLLKLRHFDLLIVDMELESNRSGLNLINVAKEKGVKSIVLSSVQSDEVTELAYNSGCDHFLSKLKYKDPLRTYIHKLTQNKNTNHFDNFIKNEYITQDSELIRQIRELTQMNIKNRCVFITGETGVGKSLIGKLIHKFTYQIDAPLVHLNCTEIPESLLESELFGHKKGAFTGATSDKIGKLEAANGGILFLDEIATMPMSMQQKLLKALDEKSFYPVGSTQKVTVSFTLLSATCEDIFQKISEGSFRKDLFYRISGMGLHIPPLRERKEDIILLINHFIKLSTRRFVIKEEAKEALKNLNWEGNVRELKKVIDKLSLSSSGVITAQDITSHLKKDDKSFTPEVISPSQKEKILTFGLKKFIEEVENEITKEVLKKNKGKITQTIKDLKISTSAFYRIFENLKV